jgi:5,10-methylene-tetrahydrofolate dehydrogenase/methenyl tetrahydrofolate cyclohydrolase
MTATLIKGAEVAAQIREELKQEIADLKAKHNVVPAWSPSSSVRTRLAGIRRPEGKNLQGAGHLLREVRSAGGDSQRSSSPAVEKLNKDPKINRHPGAAPAAQASQ